MSYFNRLNHRAYEVPAPAMVANNGGGMGFKIDPWKQLDRFLVLGTESGTYYVSERKLTDINFQLVKDLLVQDGKRVVNAVADVLQNRRAYKRTISNYVLALAASAEDEVTRAYALELAPKLLNTGTDLFQFVEASNNLRGWGKGLKRSVTNWYTGRNPDQLAYQLSKYKSRENWTHRDIFRLIHIKPETQELNALVKWSVKGFDELSPREINRLPSTILAAEVLKKETDINRAVKLIRDYRLVREVVPTELLNRPEIWDALLQDMPVNAMLRNLGKMTNVGLIGPLSDASKKIMNVLSEDMIVKSKVHPVQILLAMRTYGQGRGLKGSLSWKPNQRIVNRLDEAFYYSFRNVEKTDKNVLLGVDISGSMTSEIAGLPISSAEAAAAMALVIANSAPNHHIVGFASQVKELHIHPGMRMDDALRAVQGPFGSTRCSAAIEWALQNRISVDAFGIFTDNETNSDYQPPHTVMEQYRNKVGKKNAKLFAVATTATHISIAKPNDPNMLDVVGFDADAPRVVLDFVRG